MNNRLKQFLSAENISQSQFADTIRVARASVSHVLSGRNNPSYDFIQEIMSAYPRLNIEWLILGKGKMYREDSPARIPDVSTDYTDNLFAETENSYTPQEKEENIETSILSEASGHNTQTPINQRRVSKIIILFDDGSFQEM